MTFTLSSPAFTDGDAIPKRFARKGNNLSPPLEWHDAPAGTKSFVLLVEDPDAPRGLFRHWVAYDISAGMPGLHEGDGRRSSDLHQGANDFGNLSYDGPQPPEGHGLHHYHFRLVALDTDHLDVEAEDRADTIWAAAQPHVLAEAELVGLYER
jgi:Raf kinase inhibitor-like YbhB/YbcL family protein